MVQKLCPTEIYMELILCNTQLDEKYRGANFPPVHMHIILSG